MTSQACCVKSCVPSFYAALACLFLWGCHGHRDQPRRMPPSQAIVQSTRIYELGRDPDQQREQAFQDLLAAAHAVALEKRGASPATGSSYSLAPKGAVYPFSKVEVACLVQRADASKAKALCREFFKAVDSGFEKVIVSK